MGVCLGGWLFRALGGCPAADKLLVRRDIRSSRGSQNLTSGTLLEWL